MALHVPGFLPRDVRAIGPLRARDVPMHHLDGTLGSLLNALKDAINDSLLTSVRVNERMGALERLGHPVTLAVEITIPPGEEDRLPQDTLAMVRVRRSVRK
jgi:hypothetical protein